MLRGIPKALSPELLKVIAEMGHGDRIVIGDAFYPSASSAKSSRLVRADGVRATDLIDGILRFMPLDVNYAEHPFLIMDLMEKDRGIVETPIWDEYISIVEKYEPKGRACVGFVERFAFYEAAAKAFAVVASGETAVYGCVIMQKGVL
jgi:L-fucose mutarotase